MDERRFLEIEHAAERWHGEAADAVRELLAEVRRLRPMAFLEEIPAHTPEWLARVVALAEADAKEAVAAALAAETIEGDGPFERAEFAREMLAAGVDDWGAGEAEDVGGVVGVQQYRIALVRELNAVVAQGEGAAKACDGRFREMYAVCNTDRCEGPVERVELPCRDGGDTLFFDLCTTHREHAAKGCCGFDY